jgi:hypothetical protein
MLGDITSEKCSHKMSPFTIIHHKQKFVKQDERRDARGGNETTLQNPDKGISALKPLGSLAVLPIEVRSMIFSLLVPAARSFCPNRELLECNLPANNDLSALQQTCKAIHKEVTSLPIYKSREYSLMITDYGISFEGILTLVEDYDWDRTHRCLLVDSRAVEALRDTLHSIRRLHIKFLHRYPGAGYGLPPFWLLGRMCGEIGIDEVIESAFKKGVVVSIEATWTAQIDPANGIRSKVTKEYGVVGGPLLNQTFVRCIPGQEGAREISAEEWGELYGRHRAPHASM